MYTHTHTIWCHILGNNKKRVYLISLALKCVKSLANDFFFVWLDMRRKRIEAIVCNTYSYLIYQNEAKISFIWEVKPHTKKFTSVTLAYFSLLLSFSLFAFGWPFFCYISTIYFLSKFLLLLFLFSSTNIVGTNSSFSSMWTFWYPLIYELHWCCLHLNLSVLITNK